MPSDGVRRRWRSILENSKAAESQLAHRREGNLENSHRNGKSSQYFALEENFSQGLKICKRFYE